MATEEPQEITPAQMSMEMGLRVLEQERALLKLKHAISAIAICAVQVSADQLPAQMRPLVATLVAEMDKMGHK